MFDNFTKVEDYLNGRMSAEEKQRFEQAMESDRDLKKVVQEHDLYGLIADEIINDDLSRLIRKQMHAADAPQPKSRRPLLWTLLSALLLVAAYLGYKYLSPPDGPQLYAAYYAPPMTQQVRGDDVTNTPVNSCDSAHRILDSGDIEKAYQLFYQLQSDVKPLCREKAFFYLGLIEVKNNQFTNASSFLQKILAAPETGYEKKAREILDIISK